MGDMSKLSKRERQIMDVIYARGDATITEVLANLPNPPMRGALRTLLRIMEKKGYLVRRAVGRELIYRPKKPRTLAARSAWARVLDVFYGGSLERALAAHLADPAVAGKLSSDELQKLSDLIEQAKRRGI
jgi:predicted transcriptional regulator